MIAQFFHGPGYQRGYHDTYFEGHAGLVLVLVPDHNSHGHYGDWSAASGSFDLTDTKADAVAAVQTTWLANTDASLLYAALNTDLTAAGYTRKDGTPIT